MANYFQIFPPLVFSYRLFIFTNRGNFQSRTWVWRKFAAENRVKEGIGQESNGAANQEKQIFLLCQISPSASPTRDLGTRLACILSFRKSRHKSNLESTSKYGFFPDWGEKWRRSEHAHASYPGLFFLPGSAPRWGGKKGEFRDWTMFFAAPNLICRTELIQTPLFCRT